MPLPDTIRIGAYPFRREYARTVPRTGKGAAADGNCQPDKLSIRIVRGLSPARERVVRLHEVLHAIWWERDLPGMVSEERAIEALAEGLCAAYPDVEF